MKHLLLSIAICGLLLSIATAGESPSSASDAETNTDDSTANRENRATDNKDEETPTVLAASEDVSGEEPESKSLLEQMVDSAAGRINKCIMDIIALFGSDESNEEKKPVKKQVSDDTSTDDEYDDSSDEDENNDKSGGEKPDNDVVAGNDDTSADNDNVPDVTIQEEPKENKFSSVFGR